MGSAPTARSGLELRTVRHTSLGTGYVVAISPDSKRAVLLHPTSTRVRLWDIEEERELLSAESVSAHATQFDWLEGGRLAAHAGNAAKVFEVGTGKLVGEVSLADPKLCRHGCS